jgi:tetratricopeptide (TPR) repeat protein
MEGVEVAKRRRIPKRDLKKPDEFISTASKMISWTLENLRLILVGTIIGALIVLSIVLWRMRAKTQEVKALNSFYRASDILISIEDPASKGYLEALDELERILKDYPKTDASQLAQLQLGRGLLYAKQYTKAVETYRRFLDSGPRERLYELIAIHNLGYAYEGQGYYQKALDSFQGLLDKGESFLQSWGYLNVGRCYEKLGKRHEALTTYRTCLEKFPDSAMIPMVKHKIGALEESPASTEPAK